MENTEKALKSKFIQEEPTGLMKGIEIQHLYKVLAHKSPGNLRNSAQRLLFYSDSGSKVHLVIEF